ncbi:HEPN domain-containing protein [Mesorhizobium sp. M0027]|uniref:HEPN domain-containing protein n=1 Tax=Mesorhizobium sp. M0027 TaxID=2956848 RepID=UPI00333C736F
MASKARTAFDKNAGDIRRLLELHQQVGGEARGRRYGLEVLNKSAMVLITAFWEAYCEDIASEGLESIVNNAKSADSLPTELKKIVAKKIKSNTHELEVWKVADDGWRQYLKEHLSELKEARDRRLNTPKSPQIDELFNSALGIEKISNSWSFAKNMTAKRASEKLDKYVSLRGAIAHRGKHDTSITKANVTDYFEFVTSLVSRTGGIVNRHVKRTTGKPLWK